MRIALAVLVLMFGLSFSADLIAGALGVSAGEADLSMRFLPVSFTHLLGTDELGRDVFIRLLQGGQVSLVIGLLAALISAALGAVAGMVAGYFGGIADAALMRFADFLLALPALPLLIVLSALDASKLGFENGVPDTARIVALLALFGWMGTARLARARTLSVRAMDFVRAAKALGVPEWRIIARHVFPALSRTVGVAGALAVGNAVLAESALSFLGLGVQPPKASWGGMLTGAQENLWDHAGLAVWPGLMIFATVLAFNALADGLQDRQ